MTTEENPANILPPGTVIFRQGDKPDFAYIVISGEVEISTVRNGKRVVLVTVSPKQMFGEIALLEDRPRSATATTLKGCQVVAITKDQLEAKIASLDPFTKYWVLYRQANCDLSDPWPSSATPIPC
jgi:diguanylate cyclase